MAFRPANEHHAIQLAAFAIGLTKTIPWASLEAVIKSPLDWRKHLPAVDLSNAVDIQANPQTGNLANRVIRGVEFSHKRPDGSAEWSLSALGPEIKIETTQYTRWNEVWAKAGDILLNASGQIAAQTTDKTIGLSSIGLVMSDGFSTSESDPNFKEIFVENCDLLPGSVFRRGPIWHAYTGWFDERPEGNVLNQLNIDVRRGQPALDTNSIAELAVTVQHTQVFRPKIALDFNEEKFSEFARLFLEEIPLMHDANKRIIEQLLTPDMQKAINLHGDA